MRSSSSRPVTPGPRGSRIGKYGLRTIALAYLALILVLPVAMVFYRTFENGLQPVLQALTDPMALHALYLTVVILRCAAHSPSWRSARCAQGFCEGCWWHWRR